MLEFRLIRTETKIVCLLMITALNQIWQLRQINTLIFPIIGIEPSEFLTTSTNSSSLSNHKPTRLKWENINITTITKHHITLCKTIETTAQHIIKYANFIVFNVRIACLRLSVALMAVYFLTSIIIIFLGIQFIMSAFMVLLVVI